MSKLASFPPIIVTVGTTPIKILEYNEKRTQYLIVYPSTGKIAGNTGTVTIGIGQIPSATGGAGQQGHIMIGGETFGETAQYPNFSVSKEAIYAVASAATQIIEVFQVD